MSTIEIVVVSVIIAIVAWVGYNAYNNPQLAWPTRCYQGYLYRVAPEGHMHLVTFGKTQTPSKCGE